LLGSHLAHHDIDGVSFVAADEQYFFAFVRGDEGRIFSFELPRGCPDAAFGLLQSLGEFFLELVSEHLPERCHFCVFVAVLFDAVDDAHGPLDGNGL
jgi:hypothetical protein